MLLYVKLELELRFEILFFFISLNGLIPISVAVSRPLLATRTS